MHLRLLLVLMLGFIAVSVFVEGKKQKGRAYKKESSESEEGDDDPDEGELQDRLKCLDDINKCVETELAYSNATAEEKVRNLCTKQLKVFAMCREYKESWKITKPTTTKKPRKNKLERGGRRSRWIGRHSENDEDNVSL